MINIKDLTVLLSIINDFMKQQTAGLTHADALIQPQPSGNCMNWVLGHMLANQVLLVKLLDAEVPFDEAELDHYAYGSEPITCDGPGVLPLERLLEYHERIYQAIMARLNEMTEADFDREIPQEDGRSFPLHWCVFFRQFHLTYHLGQLEQLRQLAGRTEKII